MSMKIGFALQCSITFTEDKKVMGGTAIKSPFFQFKILPTSNSAEDPLLTTVACLDFNFFF